MSILNILITLIAIGILISIHELGHFIMAKINKVDVQEFSIGMGPKIFSINKNETMYSLRLLPVGGYVLMLGESEDNNDTNSYSSKSPLRRLSITLAGVIMNYIFALLIFTGIVYNQGYIGTSVEDVIHLSAAEDAGIKRGDQIIKLNDHNIYTNRDISIASKDIIDNNLNITIKRNGEEKDLTLDLSKKEIGIELYSNKNPNIFESLNMGYKETLTLISETGHEVKSMFKGKANLKEDVGGPVTIVRVSSQILDKGIFPFLFFIGYLSLNLTMVNILPFPALDGGMSVLLLIELISRKKIPTKFVQVINFIGFTILIILMIVITIKDILFPINL